MTLSTLKNYDVEKLKDKLEEISERATKEYKNLESMKKMRSEWDVLEFRV